MEQTFKPVAVIPHYNHGKTLGNVVTRLLAYNLPVLVVDDGSDAENLAYLSPLTAYPDVRILYRAENGGKGAAMKTGLRQALVQGFSHALQVDADGQHDLSDVPIMLQKSRENLTALICGRPVYGDDAPKSRLYGRKLTNFWIAVNTHSLQIADGMCGFRVYPLADTCTVSQTQSLGDRMDFDTEILVRLFWRNVPIIWVDTAVKYSEGGVSHFHHWRDNWLISKMHARLFFTMLTRLFKGKP